LPAGRSLDELFDELERSESAELARFAAWRRSAGLDADELRSLVPCLERSGRALFEAFLCNLDFIAFTNLASSTGAPTLLVTMLALRFAPRAVVPFARHCTQLREDACTLALLALEYDDSTVVDAVFNTTIAMSATGPPANRDALALCTRVARETLRLRRTMHYDVVVNQCLRPFPYLTQAFERSDDESGEVGYLERRLRSSLHAMRPDRVAGAYTALDVDTVVIQAHVSADDARRALDAANGDVFSAIMHCGGGSGPVTIRLTRQ
jgi:hypothetical protein